MDIGALDVVPFVPLSNVSMEKSVVEPQEVKVDLAQSTVEPQKFTPKPQKVKLDHGQGRAELHKMKVEPQKVIVDPRKMMVEPQKVAHDLRKVMRHSPKVKSSRDSLSRSPDPEQSEGEGAATLAPHCVWCSAGEGLYC